MNERELMRSKEEHAQWKELCALLLAQGAIRETDLHRSQSDMSTKGARLMRKIRVWGDSVRDLARENAFASVKQFEG